MSAEYREKSENEPHALSNMLVESGTGDMIELVQLSHLLKTVLTAVLKGHVAEDSQDSSDSEAASSHQSPLVS